MIVNEASNFKRTKVIQVTLESGDVTGGADSVDLDIDATALSGRDFILTSILVKNSSDALKDLSGLTAAYDTATGLLTLSDAVTEFADGDVITVTGTLKGQI
jgi:hypothetical protein